MGNIFYYNTIIGSIGIGENDSRITNVFFEAECCKNGYVIKQTDILARANEQIQEYLQGQRKEFCLPIDPHGTEFMRNVWNCLLNIPYGETKNYKQIALEVGKDKAYRAVGLANNKNPIPIIIPCHRVIGSNGKMVGYRAGVVIKTYLLDLESRSAII